MLQHCASHQSPLAWSPQHSLRSSRVCCGRFMEKHRTLLNVVLRRSPDLLQGSLSPLLRAPRFIDFDNKRAFFRACVRSSRAQAERRSQAIYVRREQVGLARAVSAPVRAWSRSGALAASAPLEGFGTVPGFWQPGLALLGAWHAGSWGACGKPCSETGSVG